MEDCIKTKNSPKAIETSVACSCRFTTRDRLFCLFRKEFYSIIPNYIFFLIPVASAIAWACSKFIDPWILKQLVKWNLPISWTFPIPQPYNLIIFGVILILAGLGLLWVYSYLILEGEGGPCPPFTSKTKRLVVTGPYGFVRHPSILVKLFGVIGLGIAFQSLSFVFIVVPTLLAGSLFNNRLFQEIPMEKTFGQAYVEYKKSTPALIPDFRRLFHKNTGGIS